MSFTITAASRSTSGPENMTTRPGDRYLILLIVLAACLRLVDLDFAEVQAWDEALYGLRAKSITEFGDWLDQSAHAYGGLYSAAHPPLYIWLTALAMEVAGASPVTVRLWAALFGALSVLTVSLLFRDRLSGFYAALLLGLCPFFFFSSRQGQLDVPYTFFIVLSLYFLLRYERTAASRRWLVLAGTAGGLALMSKIIVGLFVPLIAGLFILVRVIRGEKDRRRGGIEWLTLFAVSLGIALPWHVFMFFEHGDAFLDHYFGFHVIERAFSGVEENVPGLGPFFFVNQLIVMMPVAAAAVLGGLSGRRENESGTRLLLLAALLVPFLVFSLSVTKLRTYAVPMLPPLAALAGLRLAGILRQGRVDRRTLVLWAVFLVWSSSQTLRDSVQGFLTGQEIGNSFLLVLLLPAALLAALFPGRLVSGKIFVVLSLAVSLARLILVPVEYTDSGISRAAEEFEKGGCRRLVYVDRTRSRVSPQVGWYFGGIDLGWRRGRDFIFMGPGEDLDEGLLTGGAAFLLVHRDARPGAPGGAGIDVPASCRGVIEDPWYRAWSCCRQGEGRADDASSSSSMTMSP